jgi:hypothetical protein
MMIFRTNAKKEDRSDNWFFGHDEDDVPTQEKTFHLLQAPLRQF